MPVSQYDKFFGGKSGGASEALAAMRKQYGAKKGTQVFYATKNKRKGKRKRTVMPAQNALVRAAKK